MLKIRTFNLPNFLGKVQILGILGIVLTMTACAPKSSGPSSNDLADMTSDLSAPALGAGLPKALGGAGIQPKPIPKPVMLIPVKIAIVDQKPWAVDECFTFSVGKLSKFSSDYSISGNYDGLRYQSDLQSVFTEMGKTCIIQGDASEALTQFFTPVQKYVAAMHPKTGVKESNKVIAYLKAYYTYFEMAD